MNFIPKYLRTPTFGLLGLGSTGMLVFMYARQRIDKQFRHPIIQESLSLLENNVEVFEVTGAPLLVLSQIRNSASIGPDMANFSYQVRGPRGTLKVELAACAQPLSELGQNAEGKRRAEAEVGFSTDNINEFNFNEFYIPEQDLLTHLETMEEHENIEGNLNQNTKFWKIEYLYAEVEENLRVMIAPKDTDATPDEPIMKRTTFEDFQQERQDRALQLPNFRMANTKEEAEEMRRYRTKVLYQKIAYQRFYMLYGLGLGAMTAYILFRKNKRKPIVNGPLFKLVENQIMANNAIFNKLGGKIHFMEQTQGAQIEDNADFKIRFFGLDHYGVASIKASYIEKFLKWEIQELDVAIYDAERTKLEEKFVINL